MAIKCLILVGLTDRGTHRDVRLAGFQSNEVTTKRAGEEVFQRKKGGKGGEGRRIPFRLLRW